MYQESNFQPENVIVSLANSPSCKGASEVKIEHVVFQPVDLRSKNRAFVVSAGLKIERLVFGYPCPELRRRLLGICNLPLARRPAAARAPHPLLPGVGFRVQGSGFRVQGLRFRVEGTG